MIPLLRHFAVLSFLDAWFIYHNSLAEKNLKNNKSIILRLDLCKNYGGRIC